jgi:serine/threonine protein kinase
MMQETQSAMAPDRTGRREAEHVVAPGSTLLRATRPARDVMRSGSWRIGPGWAPHPSRGALAGDEQSAEAASPSVSMPGSWRPPLPPIVHEFTEAWERGEAPVAEDYLRRLDPADFQAAVDLIYREYCLAESDGQAPDGESYIARFPRYGEALRRLLRVHGACSPSMLGRLFGPDPGPGSPGQVGPSLPEAGDSIGPYVLRRELGRGSFARVFLAEQADLASRLVVVKIATRATREPWLLARARHAHIVEIVSHAVVDDAFQLICMPFWGGATLADVLAVQPPPRHRGRRPATGGDLLAALDRAAAPEYPSVHPARPAREVLAHLTYDRAIAWVIARLAEALDHAASRHVTHGDVKPSNILLSADGNPMLLDFNLAREGGPSVDPSGRPVDPGGTLAYMAPERLRALAGTGPGPESAPASDSTVRPVRPRDAIVGADAAPDPRAVDPFDGRSAVQAAHIADLYSLGMVLLEALCGRPPIEPPTPEGRDATSASPPARLVSAARAYAAARERPARTLIRDFEAASRRPIAPALRAILGPCLDPVPGRRYRRALELAEDLDRWRTDRPLAYADEPFWRQAVPRWLRARRRMLAVASLSILGFGLIATALVLVGSERLHRRDLQVLDLNMLARQWDAPESGAFLRSQRLNAEPRSWEPDDREALEVAHRALLDYGILGPGDVAAAGDWRLGDGVHYLPTADRDDLEAWLMERVYRYCRMLEDWPGSPDAWRRAIEIIDRVGGSHSIPAFAPLKHRLAAKLAAGRIPRGTASPAVSNRGTALAAVSQAPGQDARATNAPGQDARATNAPGQDARATTPAPAWLDEHLLGVVAECEAAASDGRGPDSRRAVEEALRHYERELAIRPGSFWGHYRAAAALFGLGRSDAAANHLMQCLNRRPGNASVQKQLAACLIAEQKYPQALEVCDKALESAPSYADLYFTRAYARVVSRQTGGLEEDLRRYDMLRGILPRSFWDGAGPADRAKDAGPIANVFRFPTAPDLRPGPARRLGRDEVAGIDPLEVEARATLAVLLSKDELFPLAGAEAEKILMIQPDHITARLLRVEEAIAARRFDAARSELDAVLSHPGLEDYVRDHGGSLGRFFDVTDLYLKAGKADDARTVAECARDLAIRGRCDRGGAHYNLAIVYAVLGESDCHFIDEAAKQLFRAFIVHPDFQQMYRQETRWFNAARARIDAALGRMEDPAVVRRRLMARLSAKAAPKVAER